MVYVLTFIEGIFAFVSPCILPLLPVYLAHIGASEGQKIKTRFFNTLSFVFGFTTVFLLLGLGSAGIGGLFSQYEGLITRLGGVFMVFLGLVYLDVIALNLPTKPSSLKGGDILQNYIFGISYSLAWTPCVGIFLGSALLLAANSNTAFEGLSLLFAFSMGLGIPFIIFSLMFEKLKGVLKFLVKHSKLIKQVGGVMLIVVGIALIFDVLGYYLTFFL